MTQSFTWLSTRCMFIMSTTVCVYTAVSAQDQYFIKERIDSLRPLSTNERILKIMNIMTPIRDKVPTEEGQQHIKRMLELATELDDKRMYAYVLYAEGIWHRVKFDDLSGAIPMLLTALEYAEENNCINEKAEILIELGVQYKDLGFMEKGFGYLMQANDMIRTDADKILRAGDFIVYIGDFYYRMGYYEKAAEFFLMYSEFGGLVVDDWHQANYYNTAGLTFKKLKQYDRAIEHFKKSLAIVERDSIYTWVGLLAGNIGSVYYDMGDVEKAIPLLEKDLDLSFKSGAYASAANASRFLAKIFLEKGDTKNAEKYYQQALAINKREPRMTLDKDVNEGLYNLFRKTGKTIQALMHHETFVALKDSIEKQSKVEQLKRLELKHLYEKKEQERLTQIEALNQEKIAYRNMQRATTVGALMVIVIIGLAFYAHRQRSQRKRISMQQELELNKKELQYYTEKLLQKTNLVEELNQQLDNIKVIGGIGVDKKTELLMQLIDSTILTDDEWSDFKKIFEQVHRGFFIRIRQRYTDLTEGEIRLIALLKLNLSSKEIGNMLGISVESVIKSRYRLRKKIGIEAESNLEEFIVTV